MVQLFAQITKVDEARRRVTGVVTNSNPDHDDEIFDYQGSKPYFVSAVEEMRKASGGKNLMPVRENHTLKSSGHIVEMDFDDVAQKITATAEITDDGSWKKVLKGTLTGYSVNGRYIRRWPDAGSGGAYKRYIVQPISIDLADRPCVKGAYFDLAKVDGGTEKVALVGDPDHPGPEARDMIQQVWVCKTKGHEHFFKNDAIECVLKTLAGEPTQEEVKEFAKAVPDPVEPTVEKHLNGDMGHDIATEEAAGKSHDQAVAIALSEQDKAKKTAGDGGQEEEMDEKAIKTMFQETISAGNEDLKKAFGASVDEVKKSITDQKKESDARFEEIEGALGDLAKVFTEFMAEPEEEEKPPVLKVMDRAKDTGGGKAADEEDEEEEEEEEARKSLHVIRKPGLKKSIRAALSNPITFGTSRG